MAKGQMRGNREIRKPKKDKGTAAPVPQLGVQVRLGGSTVLGKKK